MDDATIDEPERPDVGLGCFAAVVAPATTFGLGTLLFTSEAGFYALPIALLAFFWAIIVAAFYVLLLGLPFYLLVRRFTVPGWRLCGACGAVLGAAPVLLLTAANNDGAGGDPRPFLLFGLMGLIGGVSFRWRLYP